MPTSWTTAFWSRGRVRPLHIATDIETCLIQFGLSVTGRTEGAESLLTESEILEAATLFAAQGLLNRRAAAPHPSVIRALTRSVYVTRVHLASREASAMISYCRGNHFPCLSFESFAKRHPPFPAGFLDLAADTEDELSRLKDAVRFLLPVYSRMSVVGRRTRFGRPRPTAISPR